jgi:colanic acid/amylovoran biosynthesis glycosyltransferase
MGKPHRYEIKDMMRVAHAMYCYLGQSETFIWQYLRHFQNVSPVVITQKLENLDQFQLVNGEIKPIYGHLWRMAKLMNALYEKLLRDPFGYLKKLIKEEELKIIHAHYGPNGDFYLPLSTLFRIPIITTFYGYDLNRKDVIEEYQDAYQRLFNNGTHFLVEGPFMKKRLVSLGCPEEKISIQRIAINLENYPTGTRPWDGTRPIRLLFVGRLVEKKGLEYALRALAEIKEDYSFQFRIIGSGELEEKLKAMAFELNLSERIVWLGLQPHRTVLEELQACDILIQPSVTALNGDSEGGAPTIILEAQASMVPVVATSHADIPYVTCQSKSALLAPERDVDALAENIRHLFETPETWAQMGEKGRKHVEKFHDIKKEVLALENLYKGIIELDQ